MGKSHRVIAQLMALASASCLSAGCGSSVAAPSVDQARTLLIATLDAWKKGESPDALADGELGVHVADRQWSEGYRLERYEVVGERPPAGFDLDFAVDLWLRDPKGKARREKARFTVNTDPARIVVRAGF